MKNDHFRLQVKNLASANEFNADILSLLKEKHDKLTQEDEDYLLSNEYFFLCEFFSSRPDSQIRLYFRDQLINEPTKSWEKNLVSKLILKIKKTIRYVFHK